MITKSDEELKDYYEQMFAGDKQAKEAIIKAKIPLAIALASIFSKRYSDRRDEFIAVALLALVESVDKISKKELIHTNYEGYMRVRIKGALLDAIRNIHLFPVNPHVYKKGIKSDKVIQLFLNIHYRAEYFDLEDLLNYWELTDVEKIIIRKLYEGYLQEEIDINSVQYHLRSARRKIQESLRKDKES